MPIYTETWDEAKPSGSRNLSLGDDDIREFKRAVRERDNTDHHRPADETGNNNVGYHRKVTLIKLNSNPATVTDSVILFVKADASGNDELHAIDESGNVVQLTFGGAIAGLGTDGWRTGDVILSSNTTAPTGWTDISATYENNFIRISSGAPLTTGGADTHDHGANTGAHALTINQMPLHGHPTQVSTATAGGQDATGGMMLNVGSSSSFAAHTGAASNTAGQQVGGQGGGATHQHTIASANNVPVYVQMRLYQKD